MLIPKYRTLWTWDQGTCWDQSLFNRERGPSGKNGRRAMFLQDYKRLVDYASAHHYNGVVIWGAVRAHQDGFAQLRELVRYGRDHGVRILPGVSAFSYGGVCYDPRTKFDGVFDYPMEEHPHALYTWLKHHPEYAAQDKNGKPYEYGPFNVVACPSRSENLEWFKESLAWLYEEFDVDGIQVEVGDYALCHCPLCRARRHDAAPQAHYSISDMLASYQAAYEVSKAHKPDAWVICETYSSVAYDDGGGPRGDWYGWHAMPQADRELLAPLPHDAILQWGMDKAVGGYARHVWPETVYTPTDDNILRIHAGSQYSKNGPADWGVELAWELAVRARTHDLNGVSLFGEESPFNPPNEANYLALEEASGLGADNPDMSLTRFYAQTLDPLYGGAGMAARWRQLYIKGRMLLLREKLETKGSSCQPLERLTDDPDFRTKALTWSDAERIAALEGYYREARALSASLSGGACGRWSWLENSLWNIRHIIGTRV